MYLTKRFFALNLLTELLSIGLTVLASVIYIAAYTKILGRDANLGEMKRVLEVKSGLHEMKRELQSYNFEQLLSPTVQQELSVRVKALGADAVLVKNRETVYATKPFSPLDLEKSLILTDGSTEGTTL